MKNIYLAITILYLYSMFFACTQKAKPYTCGPVFKQKSIKKTFKPLVDILGLTKGKVFADIGASSGAYDVMISTLVEGVTFYIQDIDSTCLNPSELDKIIHYYAKQSKQALAKKNKFFIAMGTYKQTRLPENRFDIVYSNAAFHAIEYKNAIVTDIYQKLKPGGYFFIRDGFAKKGERKYCPDKNCKQPLAHEDELMEILQKSHFTLVKKYDNFQGYPIFKFRKK